MPRRRSRVDFLAKDAEAQLALRKEPQPDPKPRQILDDRFSAMYNELCRLAASVRRDDANATISTSTLVNEAWMKLARSPGPAPQSELLHFKCTVARVMRQIVRDAARRRSAGKRGGGSVFVTLDDSIGVPVSSNEDRIRLDAALDSLAQMSPRQARLVELRYFGGLNNTEIEAVLGVDERTVERDWRAAKAWLAAEIRRER
jgi:RNA polymerase sigma factor (TIGR02999 family)